jgi:hypothetical protein
MKFFPIKVMIAILIFASFLATFYMPKVTAAYIGPTNTTTLYSIADSYVNASSPDTNYGNDQLLYVNASSTNARAITHI